MNVTTITTYNPYQFRQLLSDVYCCKIIDTCRYIYIYINGVQIRSFILVKLRALYLKNLLK